MQEYHRPSQEGNKAERAIYRDIEKQLQHDREALFAYSRRNSPVLDQPLVDLYGLTPAEPIDTSFLSGFGIVASHWYPAIRIVSTVNLDRDAEEVFNEEFGRRFIDRYVTAGNLREALAGDPSGARFLEEMARLEFRGADDELIGALKAITGARKMYESMAA